MTGLYQYELEGFDFDFVRENTEINRMLLQEIIEVIDRFHAVSSQLSKA